MLLNYSAASVEKALKKKHSDLAKYKQDLAKSHEEAIRHAKDEMKMECKKHTLQAPHNSL